MGSRRSVQEALTDHLAYTLDHPLPIAEKSLREAFHSTADPAPVSASQVNAHGQGFHQILQMRIVGFDQCDEGDGVYHLLACPLQVGLERAPVDVPLPLPVECEQEPAWLSIRQRQQTLTTDADRAAFLFIEHESEGFTERPCRLPCPEHLVGRGGKQADVVDQAEDLHAGFALHILLEQA